jgi:hypothetical protein
VSIKEETSVEEALALVPSLSRFEDDEIQKAINVVVEAKAKYSAEGI